MSLLLPDSGLLFWMLLSFGVVFVVLAKYGFPVITKMVEEAIRDIRRQVAVLSVDIAEKVIRKNLDEEHEQMEMIDRMLDEVLAASRSN